MAFIEWSDDFRLGVQQFDDHHKHLVSLLNKTYDNYICGTSVEVLETILDELIDYATYHFAAEEYWMKENRYPELERHMEEHNRFSMRIVEIQKDFHSKRTNMSLEVMSFLKSWLSEHILKSDADYGRFISAHQALRLGDAK